MVTVTVSPALTVPEDTAIDNAPAADTFNAPNINTTHPKQADKVILILFFIFSSILCMFHTSKEILFFIVFTCLKQLLCYKNCNSLTVYIISA